MVLGGRGYRLTAFFEENSFYILSKYLRVLYVADFCGIFNKKISITLSSEVRFFSTWLSLASLPLHHCDLHHTYACCFSEEISSNTLRIG